MRRYAKWLPTVAGFALVLAFASFGPAKAQAWTGGCAYPAPYYSPYTSYYGVRVARPVVRYYRVPVVVPRPVYRVAPYRAYYPYSYGAYYSRGPAGFVHYGW